MKTIALSILVMGISLAIVIILWISFGYIGPSFSSTRLLDQQAELRQQFGLPPSPPVPKSLLEVPPSERGLVANNATNSTITSAAGGGTGNTSSSTNGTANATSSSSTTTNSNSTNAASANGTNANTARTTANSSSTHTTGAANATPPSSTATISTTTGNQDASTMPTMTTVHKEQQQPYHQYLLSLV
jgi:hypothetical protein